MLKRADDVIYGLFAILLKEALLDLIWILGSDSGLCGSCRPISLVSAFGKLFEYFILNNIRNVLDDRDYQFGFSP